MQTIIHFNKKIKVSKYASGVKPAQSAVKKVFRKLHYAFFTNMQRSGGVPWYRIITDAQGNDVNKYLVSAMAEIKCHLAPNINAALRLKGLYTPHARSHFYYFAFRYFGYYESDDFIGLNKDLRNPRKLQKFINAFSESDFAKNI